MRLNNLNIRNFQSIGEISFNFPSGLVLIDGYNFDLGSHNGVGKSAMLNAITYSIYGKLPKDVNLDELIRVDAENMSVSIDLESKGNAIRIVRSRTRKSGNVQLTINDEEIDGLAKDIEARIPDLVGLSFEQFVQVVYIFQNADQRFISLNDTDKKKFLSTLLNLDAYDGAYRIAHTKLAATELDTSNNRGKAESTEKQIGSLVVQVEDSRKELEMFETQKTQKTVELSAKVHIIKEELKALELLKKQAEKSPVLDRLTMEKGEIDKKLSVFKTVQQKINDVDKKIDASQREIGKLVAARDNPGNKCSKCGQDLPGWDVDAHKRKADEEIETLAGQQEALLDQFEQLKAIMAEEPKVTAAKEDVIAKIAEEKAKGPERFDPAIKLKDMELQNISGEVVALTQRGDIYQKSLNRALLALETTRKDLEGVKAAILGLEEQGKYLREIKKIFSPTGVKAYVFDGVVRELNARIGGYLDTLSGGAIRFEFSEDSKGKFVERCQYDGMERSINALSGGEYKRLSLAVDLALADVVCSRTSIFPNLLFLDECFDGLDLVGRESVITLLQDMANRKDIYVVDHMSETKACFTRTFKLVKSQGVTQVEA